MDIIMAEVREGRFSSSSFISVLPQYSVYLGAQGLIWMIKTEKICLRSLLSWLSCSQARAVNVCDTVGIFAGT